MRDKNNPPEDFRAARRRVWRGVVGSPVQRRQQRAHLLWQHARKTSIPICPYSLRICRHTEGQTEGHDDNSMEMNCRGKLQTQEVVGLLHEKIRKAFPVFCLTNVHAHVHTFVNLCMAEGSVSSCIV